jgi:hypothetical protein
LRYAAISFRESRLSSGDLTGGGVPGDGSLIVLF